MKKLYYENQYLKEFTAEVVEVKEKNELFHIVLDETAFFPGGGGQPSDKGTIENEEVLDIYEENGEIYHVVKNNPKKIHKVKCKIDWKHRFDGMQQHLAQHVLSGCFFTLFNANTVGFHLGKDFSTVDIEGVLDEKTIRTAEKAANDVILNNLKVKFLEPSKAELKKIKLRRALPKTNEQIRVVIIEDLDVNACCGVHPNSTLELQVIKIRKWEKHKNATRIEFLAGGRSVEDYFKKDMFTFDICRYLNCGEEDAINTIKNLSSNVKELIEENKKIKNEIGNYEIKDIIESAEKLGDIKIVKEVYKDRDIKYISKIATSITENDKTVVLFAITFEEKANLIFAASKDLKNLNMNTLLKDAITLIDGNGGGNTFMAQGGGKNNQNLNSAIEYAYMKIKNTLK